MTDCKILQLAQECEELDNQIREFTSYLINHPYISINLFDEILTHFIDLRSVADDIIKVVKDEENQIIHITNLHESIANGVDINI